MYYHADYGHEKAKDTLFVILSTFFARRIWSVWMSDASAPLRESSASA
jgi:hypothetical protein